MGSSVGCLIIHGFGGSTDEVAPLSDYLSGRGFDTYCPRLKGHTGNRKDLAGSNYREWIKSAEDGLKNLAAGCERVIIIGFSMGGLIAVNLSMAYDISALVTLNTPIYYIDMKRVMVNLLEDIKSLSFSNLKKYVQVPLSVPVPAFRNFKAILSSTMPLIKNISCPVFTAQALEDDAVKWESADYIYRNTCSNSKVVRYYRNCGHIICHSPASGELFRDVEHFIRNVTK